LLIFKDLRIRGFWLSRWAKSASATEIAATYQTLAAEMAAGRLVLPVAAVYALGEFREALARVADSGSKGKVLLIPGGPDR
jgi:NADPH:quinone reductase-like Zn-dependent oxidoreductase